VGDHQSDAGRTRTAPPAGSLPARVRFGVASCNSFQDGYFTAFDHMVREEFDLVLHLGDYIYEGAGSDKRVRNQLGPECTTLDLYRRRYAQYKTDESLQALHAAAPWVFTPDDHEFDNNCAGAISEEKNVGPAEFLAAPAPTGHVRKCRPASPPGQGARHASTAASPGDGSPTSTCSTPASTTDQPCSDGNKRPPRADGPGGP
jgi:alkaline phosphatase D